MSREYFKVFHSYLKSIEPLSDAERGRLFTAMLEYSITGEVSDLSGNERYIFPTMQANLDREIDRYANTVKSRSEAGKAGANARWQAEKENGKNGKCHLANGKNGKACQDKDKDKDKDNVFPHVVREYSAGAHVEQPTTPPNSGGSDPVAAVLADFLDRINPAASSACLDELRTFAEEMGEAVCKRAFDIALDAKKASWPYIRAILRDKHKRGIKCLADWEASEKSKEKTVEKPDAKASEIGRAAIRKLMEEANR